jgi:hypothetical protein
MRSCNLRSCDFGLSRVQSEPLCIIVIPNFYASDGRNTYLYRVKMLLPSRPMQDSNAEQRQRFAERADAASSERGVN